MHNPKAETVDDALRSIEKASQHPTRQLARELVEKRRTPTYNFETAPRELKRVMYGGTVRFKRQSLFSRLLLWWR